MADGQLENVSRTFFTWEQLFSAAADLLDECERLWGATRETIQIRLEALILRSPSTNENLTVFVDEILRNMRPLNGHLQLDTRANVAEWV